MNALLNLLFLFGQVAALAAVLYGAWLVHGTSLMEQFRPLAERLVVWLAPRRAGTAS